MKTTLKIVGLSAGALAALAAGIVAFCFLRFSSFLEEKHPMHPELAELAKTGAKPDLELGKRIYAVRNGCIDCHGPDLSGVKIMEDGAMGAFHGANITPY